LVDVPWRSLLTKEMSDFLGILAHPHRLRIIHELRSTELDVNSLQSLLEISHSRVSQHLSILRGHRVVSERRDGRHVFYRLQQPNLAKWLLDGLEFMGHEASHFAEVSSAVKKSRTVWSQTAGPEV